MSKVTLEWGKDNASVSKICLVLLLGSLVQYWTRWVLATEREVLESRAMWSWLSCYSIPLTTSLGDMVSGEENSECAL